jgi:hypothetical protein
MSYITQYKSTLESQLKGKSNRILLFDENGCQLICRLFSQEETTAMNIIGILRIDDKNLCRADNIFEDEIICFLGRDSIHYVTNILQKALSHVYIFFYQNVSEQQINDIKRLDLDKKICEISHSSLDFYPTSEKSVVGNDIFTALKMKPVVVEYHKSGENLREHVSNKIQHSLNACSIREKTDNSVLYVFGRNYDQITPIVTPWRYQSLINYLNFDIGSPGTDKFFSRHKFSLYNEVIDECTQQSNKLTDQHKATTDVSDKFQLNEKTRIIAKHVEISRDIQKHIKHKKLLEKSALEQRALIGIANRTELLELENVNAPLYQLLMSGKSATLKGLINTLNFLGEDKERSTYHQYIPPLRELLKTLKTTYAKYSKIYVYIENYICYEEIAEVALSNETNGPQVYLLSDSIQNSQFNPALVSDKFERSNDLFRILKNEIKNPATISANIYYGDIEEKINYLERHNASFKKEEEEMCDVIKSALPGLLTKEFTKLKAEKPKNKLEKNVINIKLGRLSKLSTRFSKFEKSDRKTREIITSFDKKFEPINKHDDSKKLLLALQNDEEMQLRELENEIDRREHGVNVICERTAELHAMFVEVNALVAKQTLMLGTIEENIINASDLITDGNIQLIQADKHQKDANSLSNKIIGGLVGLVILMGLGVGIKESITHGNSH